MSDAKDPREAQATDVPVGKTRNDDAGFTPSAPGPGGQNTPPTGLDHDKKNAASRF